MIDFSKINWGEIGAWLGGCTLGICGSFLFAIPKFMVVTAIDRVANVREWGWGICAAIDGFASVLATDSGLKEEDTLAKAVKLGFGTTQAYTSLADLLALILVSGEVETFEESVEKGSEIMKSKIGELADSMRALLH